MTRFRFLRHPQTGQITLLISLLVLKVGCDKPKSYGRLGSFITFLLETCHILIEGSEFSIRSSALQSTTEVDNRVEAMEQKLFELSKKFDTMNQKQSPPVPENDDRSSSGSRIKELEAELKQERARIAQLEERLKDYETEKAENAKQLSKSMDKIYDLEQDIDQATEAEMVKNEQLIYLRDIARETMRNLSDLRSEITSARRAQIDMRRFMQQEVQIVQNQIIQGKYCTSFYYI